ncbi:porin [Pseudoroseicyclus sp. CXY001]|uniref:porin n=1 Tax=Pseudoroseicyclus sp. CXY001 TaxID=3242492 RepID=UPI0035717556
MKSILLASASLFAFAGAAAAEVTLSAGATVGYNDTDNVASTDDATGFYWDFSVDLTAETVLDNGLTVGATIGGDMVDNDLGTVWTTDGYEFYITSDMASVFVGDIDLAADEYFSMPDGMDVGFDGDGVGDAGIRGELMFGSFSTYASYSIFADGGLQGLQVVATGSFGAFDVSGAYQDDQGDSGEEVFGVAVGTSFGGADIDLAYTSNQTTGADSIGVGASYPFGPVTVAGYYASNSAAPDAYGVSADYTNGPVWVNAYYDTDDTGADDFGIDGSYDVGSGLVVIAGLTDSGDDYYAGVTWDLGSGASLLFSYADDSDDDNSDDEIGSPELQEGITVEASFEF